MANFDKRVASEFAAGTKLPAVVAKLGKKNIAPVSRAYWRLDGESRPFEAEIREDRKALRKAVLAARKSGDRREIVAARAGISRAEVVAIEGKRPVYTGKGTKRHLAAPAA